MPPDPVDFLRFCWHHAVDRLRTARRQVQWRRRQLQAPIHPKRQHLHETFTVGERAADLMAKYLGSWRFVLIQNGIILAWVLLNLTGWILRWDPWPFLFLNIIMSWQAANSSPILQMSQNRQAAKDRARDDLEANEVDQLFAINQQQIAILNQQTEILNLLKARDTASPTEMVTIPASTLAASSPAPKRVARKRAAAAKDAHNGG